MKRMFLWISLSIRRYHSGSLRRQCGWLKATKSFHCCLIHRPIKDNVVSPGGRCVLTFPSTAVHQYMITTLFYRHIHPRSKVENNQHHGRVLGIQQSNINRRRKSTNQPTLTNHQRRQQCRIRRHRQPPLPNPHLRSQHGRVPHRTTQRPAPRCDEQDGKERTI